jgi:hypothetical protein
MALCYNYTVIAPNRFKIFTWITQDVYASTTTSTSGYIKSSSIVPGATTTRHPVARALPQPCRAPRLLVTRPRALRQPCRAPRLLVSGCTRSTSTSLCAVTTRLRLHVLYLNLSACRDYASLGHTCSTSTSSCTASTRLHFPGCSDLLRLRRASGCLGTSRGSSRRSSSTTPPRAGSSSTTSPPPRVRVPRHIARLVTRLVAPLVVDYSASRRLIVNYFASAARPGASARRAARHAARRAARLRLLRLAQACRRLPRLRRASRCPGTSRGSSLVIDYFAYAARPGASARRAARRVARCAAHRQLLRLRRASGCLGTTRSPS